MLSKILKKIPENWRDQLYGIIFKSDTFYGKRFDFVLLVMILMSVAVVMLESVKKFSADYGSLFSTFEWFFSILFTVEYIARIVAARKPLRYIFSFMGIIDLISLSPVYISIFFDGAHYLFVIRTIRLLRVFRIMKLVRYVKEADMLFRALKESRYKITVFLGAVLSTVTIMGTMMYMIEGEANGFTSIPKSIYWSIVTLTTVGYGDIAPQTIIGQTISSIIMITGYAIIAVPTGIVTAEMTSQLTKGKSSRKCCKCENSEVDENAVYCKMCGSKIG